MLTASHTARRQRQNGTIRYDPDISGDDMQAAFRTVCHNRRHFPPDADIWHLRFHVTTRLPQMLAEVCAGRWRLSPLSLVRRRDGTIVALWSAEDAVVITALTRVLIPFLSISDRCEHLRGHGGGTQSLRCAQAADHPGRVYVCLPH